MKIPNVGWDLQYKVCFSYKKIEIMGEILGLLDMLLLAVGGVTSFLNWNSGKKNPWWSWITLGLGVVLTIIGIINYFNN